MPSRRRSRSKNLGTNLADVQRRMRSLERKPVKTKLQAKVVKAVNIAPETITPDEVSFGTNIVTTEDPTTILNPREGQLVVNPDTESTSIYSAEAGEYITFPSVDAVARTTANGKNKIYREASEPTGGTYAEGDLWFNTSADNAFSRYAPASTSTVSNKSLTNNIATLTTSAAHKFVVGESVTVSGVDSTFNGTYTVTATPTTTTLRYAKTATNVSSTSATGSISNTAGWKLAQLGDGALLNISANKITAGTIDASVITVSNLDAGKITTGTLSANYINGGAINGVTINATSGGKIGAWNIGAASQTGTGTYQALTSNILATGDDASKLEISYTIDTTDYSITGRNSYLLYLSNSYSSITFGTDSVTNSTIAGRITLDTDGTSITMGFDGQGSGQVINLTADTVSITGDLAVSGSFSVTSTSYDINGLKNILATDVTGEPTGGSDGDIVLVYTV